MSISDGGLVAAGMIHPPGTERPLHYRLSCLQDKVQGLLERLNLSEKDFLVCEGPAPLVKNPQSSLKVEQVRSVFEAVARSLGVCVPGRVNPRTVHTEILSLRGKQLARREVKIVAQETASRIFGQQFTDIVAGSTTGRAKKIPQDIVDALLIGVLALSRIQQASQLNLDSYELFQPNRTASSAVSNRALVWSAADYRKAAGRR